jgi:GTP cyclohydrolase II
MIVKLTENTLNTRYGVFTESLFYDGKKEAIAFSMGTLDGAQNVLCRVHSSCIHGHYFNSIECDCQEQLNNSQKRIQEAGCGLIILLDQEGKGNGHFALLHSISEKRKGAKQADAYEKVGFQRDARDFSAAAKIIQALGIKSVRMLTDNPGKVETLRQFDVEVTGTQTP